MSVRLRWMRMYYEDDEKGRSCLHVEQIVELRPPGAVVERMGLHRRGDEPSDAACTMMLGNLPITCGSVPIDMMFPEGMGFDPVRKFVVHRCEDLHVEIEPPRPDGIPYDVTVFVRDPAKRHVRAESFL